MSNYLVTKLGSNKALVIGASCYVVYSASFALPSAKFSNPDFPLSKPVISFIIILASCIIGFGASILWVSEGAYLAKCAD
jgi:hypothetical protein